MKLLKKYIFTAIVYFLLLGLYAKGTESGMYFRVLFVTVVFVMIMSRFIRKDILDYHNKIRIISSGMKYLAVITDIMEEGTTEYINIENYFMYIKVRYFDNDHELRDEWVSTNGVYDENRDKFGLWQTVIICENAESIILISDKAEELAVEDTSEGAIVSDREILMDMSISGITKKQVPQKK